MNKNLLRLLSVSVIAMTISACNTGGSEFRREADYTKPATDFTLNTNGVALMEKDSFQLEPTFSPRLAYSSKLTFESADETVAKVEEDGKIKAVAAGITTVTAKYTNGEFVVAKEIPVYVCAPIVKESDQRRYAKNQQKYQKALAKDKLKKQEIRHNFTYLGNDRVSGYNDNCDYVLGKSDGYFLVDGFEGKQKTTNGVLEDIRYAWLFSTSKDYATTLYHLTGSTKNRLTVPTRSYIGKPRVDVVYQMLDTLFTSGREIATDIEEDALEETTLERLANGSYAGFTHGYFKNDNYEIQYLRFQGQGKDTVSPDDENNMQIPADTPYIFDQDVAILWVNGVVKYEYIDQSMTYTAWGKDYKRSTQIEFIHSMDDEVTLVYPNNDEYNKVDSLFDL